jgi:putative DNA methylase
MIPKDCKRLAEVDFPIAVVSRHAAREKSIRHGHPSTLHLWWARRPLASCRAMLLGLLLPDPCDSLCPPDFKAKAREVFKPIPGVVKVGPKDADLRQALLKFIGDFADWDLAADRPYLEAARGLVKAAHPEETPLVVDPFAGGGSIPLEALRLGCDAFASDLNPVACLIEKVLLEDIPRHGPQLAEELRRVGAEVKKAAEEELAEFYPPDPDGARPIAYLWARTVRCEAPNCGAEIPLVRSFWLSKKASRRRALRPKVVRKKGSTPVVEFEVFEPLAEKEVAGGTVSRAKATCLCCDTVLPPERVRAQLAEQHGGADVQFDAKGKRIGGARLLAVVVLRAGEPGRCYREPTVEDYKAVWKATRRAEEIAGEKGADGLSVIPDEPLPPVGTLGFRVQRYGMLRWGDLFTARQTVALITFSCFLKQLGGTKEIGRILISRLANGSSSLCRWNPNPGGFAEKIEATFSRQALPITWDFAETSPVAGTSGDWEGGVEWLVKAVEAASVVHQPGQAGLADATASPLPDAACGLWFTDPPYYDAIPYSDLSDFFLVWLKRALPGLPLLRDPFDPANPLSPKTREAVQDETKKVNGKPKDRAFFEETMAKAFAEGRRVLRDDGIGSVVFAHKTTEGWEALLSGMIRGGWTITGSWPIATEMGTRLRARDSAALATSVHLVCRPRPEDAPVGDWEDVFRRLPRRVGEWMQRLQEEGVHGADLVFACIGPALELYSRYARVVDAADREVPPGGDPEAEEPHRRGFLAYVWEAVGRAALEQVLGTAEGKARNGAAGALEEDARLTALFLWTLQSSEGAGPLPPDPSPPRGEGRKRPAAEEADEEESDAGGEDEDEEETPRTKAKGFTLVFDVVRRFAQPLGIHLPTWEGGILETKKGTVRLLPVAERAEQLFGKDGAGAVADRLETRGRRSGLVQGMLFPEAGPEVRSRKGKRSRGGAEVPEESLTARREATALDRVHAAMLLQSAGKTNALRALLQEETARGPDFLRLANALSALYPRGSEEKRLLDAVLLAVSRR